uniref:STAS domain-containing protein n=1 Tax=Strongyloides papillosus TaxID=174720 RepID=A0A0N5BEF8_STREA
MEVLHEEEISNHQRTFLTQEQFDNIHQFLPPPKSSLIKNFIHFLIKPFTSISKFLHFIISFIPILQWLPTYSIKNSLSGDVMAGLTIGIVQVPQGIAYALLTGVDPIYGLYSSFFAIIFYMIFGTSKYVSIGSFAIVSLMTGVAANNVMRRLEKEALTEQVHYLEKHTGEQIDINNLTEITSNEFKDLDRITLVTTLTFFVGLVQIALGIFHFDFLASYLSDQVVSGFAVGAAVHVCVVQFNKLFQLDSKSFSGIGYIIKQFIDVCGRLSYMNIPSTLISLFGFIFLYFGKDFINIYYKKHLLLPIPFDFLLVLITTYGSYLFQLNEKFDVKIVNDVPRGLKYPTLPRLDLFPYMLSEMAEIAIVVIAIHLSMCKIFNSKMGTKTDNNQELYAIGFTALLSSFFQVYPVSSALGRSMLNVECGASTQFAGFFTALVLLLVILFLGPLLASLPMCTLAVIIIFSMKSIFLKMKELKSLWRISKIDFLIWIVSFTATTAFNVMQGLLISIGFALATVIIRMQWPKWHGLSRLGETEEYRDAGRYAQNERIDNVIVFRFDAPLLFINVDHFGKSIEKALKKMEEDDDEEREKRSSVDCECCPNNNNETTITSQMVNKSILEKIGVLSSKKIDDRICKHLVIDCSGFTVVDYSSTTALMDLFHQFGKKNITIYFAGAKAPIRDQFEKCGFYKKVPKSFFYPTIHDAILAIKSLEGPQFTKTFLPQPIDLTKKRGSIFYQSQMDYRTVDSEVPDVVIY